MNHRSSLLPAVFWLLLFVFCLLPFLAQAGDHVPLVQAVDAVGMTVGDMDRSVEFFSTVLSFERVSDVEVRKVWAFKRFLVRDPDGHVMELAEK